MDDPREGDLSRAHTQMNNTRWRRARRQVLGLIYESDYTPLSQIGLQPGHSTLQYPPYVETNDLHVLAAYPHRSSPSTTWQYVTCPGAGVLGLWQWYSPVQWFVWQPFTLVPPPCEKAGSEGASMPRKASVRRRCFSMEGCPVGRAT